MDILMRFGSKTSADIFCGYIGELWSYSLDSFARHLSKGWARESTGKLNTRRRHGMVVAMAMHGVGGMLVVGGDLEHVFEM
jgi:hypothetical protein